MERIILHCDCNGFYASVECVFNPELKKVPMAVCGNPENRHGIILAKNELAKQYNIKTAETVQSALRKCPELVLVPPRHDEYSRFSKLVNKIYLDYTDLIEPFGIDESWLDVTGVTHLFGTGKDIADSIRERVKKELGLTVSAGVSYNKIFAKLGSDYKKPDATTIISKENYKDILYPLPVSRLLYVGKKTYSDLKKMGIYTIGNLADAPRDILSLRFGKMGEQLHDYANGNDSSEVTSYMSPEKAKSIGNGMTFKKDLVKQEEIKLGTIALADQVAYRLRKSGLKCYTVSVLIKFFDFKSMSRQKRLDSPTDLSKVISDTVLELLSKEKLKPIRTLTITGSNLTDLNDTPVQLNIFEKLDNTLEKQDKLENTLDNIRDKFGKDAIKRGSIMKNDIGAD